MKLLCYELITYPRLYYSKNETHTDLRGKSFYLEKVKSSHDFDFSMT